MPSTVARISSEQVVELSGATYRQIHYWVRLGYLRPENTGRGSGHPFSWPEEEISVAARIVRLLELGFLLDAAVLLAREPSELQRAAARLVELVENRGGDGNAPPSA